jgi:hypothetical protein
LSIATFIGIASLGFSFFAPWSEGIGAEAFGLGFLLLVAALVAWRTQRFRYLSATWGLFLGIWVVVLELLFSVLIGNGHAQVVDNTASYSSIAVIAVTVVAVAGLILSLIARGRDP